MELTSTEWVIPAKWQHGQLLNMLNFFSYIELYPKWLSIQTNSVNIQEEIVEHPNQISTWEKSFLLLINKKALVNFIG